MSKLLIPSLALAALLSVTSAEAGDPETGLAHGARAGLAAMADLQRDGVARQRVGFEAAAAQWAAP